MRFLLESVFYYFKVEIVLFGYYNGEENTWVGY